MHSCKRKLNILEKQLKEQDRRWEELTTLHPLTGVRVRDTVPPIKDALKELYDGKRRARKTRPRVDPPAGQCAAAPAAADPMAGPADEQGFWLQDEYSGPPKAASMSRKLHPCQHGAMAAPARLAKRASDIQSAVSRN